MVTGEGGDLLAGVAGGHAHAAAGHGQGGVDPAVDGRARVVGMAVGAQAHVDGDRQTQLLAQVEQVLDRVHQARGVVEGAAALEVVLGQ